MRVISHTSPAPRLLNSVVPELRETESPADQPNVPSRLKGGSLFAGNGRAIFVGILLGAVALSVAGVLYERHLAARHREEFARKLMLVAARSVSASPNIITTPAPIVVRITLDLLHVTAISLGHPRLAVINGEQVTEGDRITVHTPAASVTVTLQIVKIADSRIDLSDGTQVITARLEARDTTRTTRP